MMWALIKSRFAVICLVAVAGAASGAAWWINGTRWQSRLNAERLKHTEALAAGYKASLEKYVEANRRSLEAEDEIRRLETLASEKTNIYRDAVKGDPKCAEQASQPLVCPRPW